MVFLVKFGMALKPVGKSISVKSNQPATDVDKLPAEVRTELTEHQKKNKGHTIVPVFTHDKRQQPPKPQYCFVAATQEHQVALHEYMASQGLNIGQVLAPTAQAFFKHMVTLNNSGKLPNLAEEGARKKFLADYAKTHSVVTTAKTTKAKPAGKKSFLAKLFSWGSKS